jgi:hypothetical protein
VLRPNPAPLRVLGRRRRRGGGWPLAHLGTVALRPLRPCRAAPLGCSATTLGACFIGLNQNGPTNADTQRGSTCPWSAGIRGLGKAESAQARATDRFFSRHLLARACKALRLYRSPRMCEPPSNPTSRPFHQLLLSFCSADRPCPIPAHGARISRSAPACLRRDGSQHPWCPY